MFWVRNIGVLFLLRKISVAETAQKREQHQQQQYRVSVFNLLIPIFMMSIWTNDSFVCLLGVRNSLCWALFVFSMRSYALLCVCVHSRVLPCVTVIYIYIWIGLWQALFVNRVRSCLFAISLNWPSLEMFQYRAFSMSWIGLCQLFDCPMRTLCPNHHLFIRNFYRLKLT